MIDSPLGIVSYICKDYTKIQKFIIYATNHKMSKVSDMTIVFQIYRYEKVYPHRFYFVDAKREKFSM